MIYRFRKEVPTHCPRCAVGELPEASTSFVGPLTMTNILKAYLSGWQIHKVWVKLWVLPLYWKWHAFCGDCMLKDELYRSLSDTLIGSLPRSDWRCGTFRIPFPID